MRRKDKEITLNVSTKHVKLRVAIFIVSVVIAIGSISFGVYSCSNQSLEKTGWVNFDLSKYTDSKYLGYGNNIHLTYYVDKNDDVKSINRNVLSLLMNKSKYIYSLIDSKSTSSYKTNGISALNNNLNTRLEIDKELYDILLDALNKTNDGSNVYSIYSGLLNNYWDNNFIMSKLDNKNYDPLVNDSSKIKLDEIVKVVKDLSNYNLKLEDNNGYYATLNVNDKVIELVDDLGLFPNYLDLNSLFYSYYLESLNKAFNEANYIKGYLYTDTGEMVFMSDSFTSSNDIYIYNKDKSASKIGIIKNKGKCNVSTIRSFGVDNEAYYHSFNNLGNEVNRSLNYNYQTGYSSDYINSSTIISTNLNLIDLTYKNLNLVLNEDISSYSSNLSINDYAAVILKEEKGTIYLTDTNTYYEDYNNETYNRKNL